MMIARCPVAVSICANIASGDSRRRLRRCAELKAKIRSSVDGKRQQERYEYKWYKEKQY